MLSPIDSQVLAGSGPVAQCEQSLCVTGSARFELSNVSKILTGLAALGDTPAKLFSSAVHEIQLASAQQAVFEIPKTRNFTEGAILFYKFCIAAHQNGTGLIPPISIIAAAMSCKKQPIILARERLDRDDIHYLRTYAPRSGQRCTSVIYIDQHSGNPVVVKQSDLIINELIRFLSQNLPNSKFHSSIPTQAELAKQFRCALKFVGAARKCLPPDLRNTWDRIVTSRRNVIRPREASQRQRAFKALRHCLHKFESEKTPIPTYKNMAKQEGVSFDSINKARSQLPTKEIDKLRAAYQLSRQMESQLNSATTLTQSTSIQPISNLQQVALQETTLSTRIEAGTALPSKHRKLYRQNKAVPRKLNRPNTETVKASKIESHSTLTDLCPPKLSPAPCPKSDNNIKRSGTQPAAQLN